MGSLVIHPGCCKDDKVLGSYLENPLFLPTYAGDLRPCHAFWLLERRTGSLSPLRRHIDSLELV